MSSLLQRLRAPVVSKVTVPADRAAVFDVLADPETYPSWLVGAARMRQVDDDFPAAGSGFEHTVGAGPVALDDHTESVGVDEDRRLALRVHAGPFHARVEFELTDHGGETEVRMTERPIGAFSVLTPVLRPSLKARNAASLSNLREFVAARTPT